MRVEYGSVEKDGSPDLDADWLADGWVVLLRKWLADAENAGVAWVDKARLTRFIPPGQIYPPVLEALMPAS